MALPRLPKGVAIVTARSWASDVFQRWWQTVAESIEGSISGLSDAVTRIDSAETSLGALESPQYLTLANTASLTNERRFVAFGGLASADAGAGSTFTVDFASIADQRILANVSGGSAKPTATAPASLLGIGSALKLTTARNISATGDLAWTVSFDGSGNATAAATITAIGQSIDVTGTVQADSLRLDQVATASAVTTTHTTPVSINGVTYYLMLSNVP